MPDPIVIKALLQSLEDLVKKGRPSRSSGDVTPKSGITAQTKEQKILQQRNEHLVQLIEEQNKTINRLNEYNKKLVKSIDEIKDIEKDEVKKKEEEDQKQDVPPSEDEQLIEEQREQAYETGEYQEESLKLLRMIVKNTSNLKGGKGEGEEDSSFLSDAVSTAVGATVAGLAKRGVAGALGKAGGALAKRFPKSKIATSLGGKLQKAGTAVGEKGILGASASGLRTGAAKIATKVGATKIATRLAPAAAVGGGAMAAGAMATPSAAAIPSSAGTAASAVPSAAQAADVVGDTASGAAKAASPAAGGVGTAAAEVAQSGGGFWSSLWGGVKNFASSVKDTVKGVASFITDPVGFLKANQKSLIGGMKKIPVLGSIIETIIGYFNIKDILSNPDLTAQEKKEMIGTEIGSRFGSLAGGVIGGSLGMTVGGPVGAALVGIGGSFGGEWLGGKIAELIGPEMIYDIANVVTGKSLINVEETEQPAEPEVEQPEAVPTPEPAAMDMEVPSTPTTPDVSATTEAAKAPEMPITQDAAAVATAAALPTPEMPQNVEQPVEGETPEQKVMRENVSKAWEQSSRILTFGLGGKEEKPVETTPTAPPPAALQSAPNLQNVTADSLSITSGTAAINAASVNLLGQPTQPTATTPTTTDAKQVKEAEAKAEVKAEEKEKQPEEKKKTTLDRIFGDSTLGKIGKTATMVLNPVAAIMDKVESDYIQNQEDQKLLADAEKAKQTSSAEGETPNTTNAEVESPKTAFDVMRSGLKNSFDRLTSPLKSAYDALVGTEETEKVVPEMVVNNAVIHQLNGKSIEAIPQWNKEDSNMSEKLYDQTMSKNEPIGEQSAPSSVIVNNNNNVTKESSSLFQTTPNSHPSEPTLNRIAFGQDLIMAV